MGLDGRNRPLNETARAMAAKQLFSSRASTSTRAFPLRALARGRSLVPGNGDHSLFLRAFSGVSISGSTPDDWLASFVSGDRAIGHDLCFRGPSLGKSGRSGRSISREVRISRSEGRPSLFEESTGYFSSGIGVLAIIHGQRQKVFFRRFVVHARGGQEHRISVAGHHSAMRLLCNFASLKRQNSSRRFPRSLDETYSLRSSAPGTVRAHFESEGNSSVSVGRVRSREAVRNASSSGRSANTPAPRADACRTRLRCDSRGSCGRSWSQVSRAICAKLSRSTISRYRSGSRRFK